MCQLDGIILAPTSPSNWKDNDKHPQWLKFEGLSNFILKGQGIFNGRGKDWWVCKRAGFCQKAPTVSYFLQN